EQFHRGCRGGIGGDLGLDDCHQGQSSATTQMLSFDPSPFTTYPAPLAVAPNPASENEIRGESASLVTNLNRTIPAGVSLANAPKSTGSAVMTASSLVSSSVTPLLPRVCREQEPSVSSPDMSATKLSSGSYT